MGTAGSILFVAQVLVAAVVSGLLWSRAKQRTDARVAEGSYTMDDFESHEDDVG